MNLAKEAHDYYEQIRERARRLMGRPKIDDETATVASDCLRLAEENEVLMQTAELLTRRVRSEAELREQREDDVLLRLVQTRIQRGADRTSAAHLLRDLGFDDLADEISE